MWGAILRGDAETCAYLQDPSDTQQMAGLPYDEACDAWTTPRPATRHTARYGIRRPRHNTYASVIHSQAPVLPTDVTRVTSRQACQNGAQALTRTANDLLETKESLCGDCYQPVAGPGQPAWRDAYDDELAKLLINGEARDRLIRQAYVDLANQSSQLPSQPLLCKALARLYHHDPTHRLRVNPSWDQEDWAVARWYAKQCYPYVTAAGSTAFYEPPLPRKAWVDNLMQQLGPAINYMGCAGLRQAEMQPCPCAPESGERAVYARKPTQLQLKAFQDQFAQQYRKAAAQDQQQQLQAMYGLFPEGAAGDRLAAEQAAIVRDQAALRDAVNPDYAERIYRAQVDDHRRQTVANGVRATQLLERTGNAL